MRHRTAPGSAETFNLTKDEGHEKEYYLSRYSPKMHPGPRDGRANSLAQKRPWIVHHHAPAPTERGNQRLRNPGGEAIAFDRSVERARRIDPVAAQCDEKGQGSPLAARVATGQAAPALRRGAMVILTVHQRA